jgi:phosphotransferase system  glucose/maltose/N-acetylglucosamine-specific IIC component
MDIVFNLEPALVIGLVVSTLLPLLVGLVTTRVTNGSIKAVLLAVLALVTSLLTELATSINNGTQYDLGQGLLLALPTFLIAVGMHYGLWKPVGAATGAQSVKATTIIDRSKVALTQGDDGVWRA